MTDGAGIDVWIRAAGDTKPQCTSSKQLLEFLQLYLNNDRVFLKKKKQRKIKNHSSCG